MRFIGRRRLQPRTVHDVISRPRQRVVRLRERAWRLEISASAFVRAITRHWVRSGVAGLVVLALVVGLLRGVGRANIATLYATSCLGGWANPQLAEGKPDVPPGSDAELFTAKNSASLNGVLAQLYCGGFKGEVPIGAAPKKVVLNLSWTVLGAQETGNRKQETDNTGVVPVETQNFASPSIEAPINIDINATSEQQVEALLDASEGQAVKVEEMAPPVESAPPEEIAPVEAQRATSQPIEPTPPLIEPPAVETSRLPFVRTVMAQEAPVDFDSAPTEEIAPVGTQNFASSPDTPNPVETLRATSQPIEPPVIEKKPPKPLPLDESIILIPDDKPPTDEPTSTPDSSSVTPTSTQLLPTDTEPPFLEISYTLDGKDWNTVAKVTSKSWSGLAVELPLQSWDELATVQVALQAVPTAAEQPQVLLDSVYLTVTYETDATDVQPQPDFNRDTIVQLFADGDINLVRVFSASRQHQQLWAYQSSGEGTWTLVAEEPELDPLAASLLYGGTIIWVTGGGGTIAMYQVSGSTFSSQTIEPEGTTDLALSDGLFVRWNGTSLALQYTDSTPIDSAPTKDRAAFLSELRGSAAVAVTTTAPISPAPEADVSTEIKPAETLHVTSTQTKPTTTPTKDVQLPPSPPDKPIITE
jgi:hypothetical protein